MCGVICLSGGLKNEDNCVPEMNVASVHTCLNGEIYVYLYVCQRCYWLKTLMLNTWNPCLNLNMILGVLAT